MNKMIAFKSMIISFVLFASKLYAFDYNNYCRDMHIKCTGAYDSNYKYKDICEKSKCHDEFPLECSGVCVRTKQDCKILNAKLALHTSFGSSSRKLLSKIPKCQQMPYILKPSDVCSLNFKTCQIRESMFWPTYKQVKCPCPKQYRYECVYVIFPNLCK